jgi:hypothetical protein
MHGINTMGAPLELVPSPFTLNKYGSVAILFARYIRLLKKSPTQLTISGQVFFQACFSASTLRSAVDFLPGTLTVTPFGFAGGVAITVLKKYRVVNWFGWVTVIVGFGLFSTIRADSSVGKWVGYQILCAIGLGILVRSSFSLAT